MQIHSSQEKKKYGTFYICHFCYPVEICSLLLLRFAVVNMWQKGAAAGRSMFVL